MKLVSLGVVLVAIFGLSVRAKAQDVLFDFNSSLAHSGLPIDATSGGVTAHFTATGAGFSIQSANTLGFTPLGFDGNCIYPDSVFAADLQIQFSKALGDFSIMYAPEEYACDSSATMRVTAYFDGVLVGTNTTTANPPGTWPTGTLRFTSAQPFNYVVVHYDAAPPTGGDWGPVFLADNMRISLSSAIAAIDDAYSVPVNIQLNVAAASGVLLNDQNAVGATAVLVTPPSHGKLSLLQSGSFTYTPDRNYVGADSFVYDASLNGHVSNKATVTIQIQPVLTRLSITPVAMLGGDKAQGTATLSVKAPTGGTTIALGSNAASATVPAQITVATGATAASFTISSQSVSVKTLVTLTASVGGVSKPASFTLYPLSLLKSFVAKPTTWVGGASATATLTLSTPVPTGSEFVSLSSGSPILTVPSAVSFTAGMSTATVKIVTTPVSATKTVAVSASLNGVKLTETVTVTTPPISSLKFKVSSVKGGNSTTATVTLAGPAGPQGDVMQLASGSSVVTVPTTVTVPAGATTVTFPVTTLAVTAKTSVKITAALGTSTLGAALTVTK